MRDILKIAGIYTALILGAGFASGREILFFFIRFGTKGFWGLILSGFIFSFIGYIVCDLANKKQIYMSDKFLSFIFQDFYCAAKFIIKIFLFFSYATMLSATGAFFQQQFAFKNIFGVLFMAILCFLIYFLGTNFMAKIKGYEKVLANENATFFDNNHVMMEERIKEIVSRIKSTKNK